MSWLALFVMLVVAFGKPQEFSTVCSGLGPKCVVVPGVVDGHTAYGSFDDSLTQTGWGVLKVQTSSNPAVSDNLKMYGAGYLEGYLTHQRIYEQYVNMYTTFWPTDDSEIPRIREWFDKQENWTRIQMKAFGQKDTPYWQQVQALMAQYDGLRQGFADINKQPLSQPVSFVVQVLSGWGDLLDLIPALNPSKRPQWDKMSPEEVQMQLGRSGHCSAIVKLNGDMSDILMSHSSWFVYSGTNRIYKHYFLDLNIPETSAKKISFSSYPGALVSIDDFYIMDSGMVMLQTTNVIANMSLYDQISSAALLAWQRVRLANTMSNDGKAWCEIVAHLNSGTYNNQYMVIDLKKFHRYEGIDDGTLWVAEQIPGLVKYADETEILRYGYWPSYNIAFFPDIWNVSGYASLGANSSHAMAPRAQIFRRDAGTVKDMESLKHIMRYNDYLHDPISNGDPGKAICSRFDLEKNGASAAGCYDTKVTSYDLALKGISQAINGPTTQNGIPPFAWTGPWSNITHLGIPQIFTFEFELMDPEW